MGRIPIWFAWGALFALLAPGAAPASQASKDDEKLTKQVTKIDERFVKALEDLAKKYDEAKDPEAAHLLASCAVGFGSKDGKVAAIKGGWEVDLFVGKVRGGEILADRNPIDTALRAIATDYKKLLDSLFPQLKKGELSLAARKLVHDAVPKYELARGADEYILATQRFNQLRRAMGLRAILWDFETSSKLILACWYMGETDDYRTEDKSDASSPLYTSAVELAKQKCHRPLYRKLQEFPDGLRSYALLRQDILNPNARQLWLAHWAGGKKVDPMTAYSIPQLEYRKDIPTPSERYERETVVEAWPGWKDIEDTVILGGKKVPVVRYPHAAEQEVPSAFSNGRGAMEHGWEKSELDFLAKAGTPIMLRVFAKGSPSEVSIELKDRSSKKLGTRTYVNGDKRVSFYPDWPTVLILPEAQLEAGMEYNISVTCKMDGIPIERSWSFKTRAK